MTPALGTRGNSLRFDSTPGRGGVNSDFTQKSRGVAATANSGRNEMGEADGPSTSLGLRSGRLPGGRVCITARVREATQARIPRGGLKSVPNRELLPGGGLSPKTGYEPAAANHQVPRPNDTFPIPSHRPSQSPAVGVGYVAPKGLGTRVNKPLMRKPRAPMFRAPARNGYCRGHLRGH